MLYNGPWLGIFGPTDLRGVVFASPAAVSGFSGFNSGYIKAFVRGSEGAVWSRNTTNGGASWSKWTSFGGRLAHNTGPGAGGYSGWLIVQGTDHQLWQSDGISWSAVGGPPEALSASSPGVTYTMGRTYVFVTSASGNVWYGGHDVAGRFPYWTSVGSPP
jgi:hypothetical protein